MSVARSIPHCGGCEDAGVKFGSMTEFKDKLSQSLKRKGLTRKKWSGEDMRPELGQGKKSKPENLS